MEGNEDRLRAAHLCEDHTDIQRQAGSRHGTNSVEKNGRRRRKPEPSRSENIEGQQLHGRYTGFHSHCTTGSRADDRNWHVLEKGGFKVKAWQSNKGLSNNRDQEGGEVNVLTGSVEDKVLGVVWNITEDSFKFKVKNEAIEGLNSTKLTKRSILSQVERIFDPTGFAWAFLIPAKIRLQELWRQGSEWDEDLPSAVQQKWIALYREMKELNKVSFQGSLSPHQPAEHRPTVCIFADASHGAFGASAYIRWMTINEEHDVRFN